MAQSINQIGNPESVAMTALPSMPSKLPEPMDRRTFGIRALMVAAGLMIGTPEAEAKEVYGVNISRLRETLLQNGILVLTHNGVSAAEDEFTRVAGNMPLGPITKRFGKKVAKKRCPLKIIAGVDSQGRDVTKEIETIDVTVVDATGGVLPGNLGAVIGDKKFGLILCAGHIHDIEKLADLSDQFRARESLLLLGGCRAASLIAKYHRPNRLVAGSYDGISTETFTHLTKTTAASIVGKQCNTWPEYFTNMQRNYSFELQRRPGTYIFPGNPRYEGVAGIRG